LNDEVVLVFPNGFPRGSQVGVPEDQLFLGVEWLSCPITLPSRGFLLETTVQGSERLWPSERFLYGLDLQVGLYKFANKGEQERIEEGVTVPTPAYELVFEYVWEHLLGLAYELLTELKLLTH
jgi:hypothetical protein